MNLEETIKSIAATIRENYVESETGDRVAKRIEEYIGSPTWNKLISRDDVYRIIYNINCIISTESDDGHFYITRQNQNDSQGTGIERITPHFIQISSFKNISDEFVRQTYSEFFKTARDNLLIDLRGCPGGSPETAYYILCHLFDTGTPLFELQTRNYAPKIFKSADSVPFYPNYNNITKFKGTVKVIVDEYTYSAAESLAFVIQHRGRGQIYGSKTSGYAHITHPIKIGDIWLYLPYSRTCDPDTHKDWENIGVIPDYPVGSKEFISLVYNELAANYMTPF